MMQRYWTLELLKKLLWHLFSPKCRDVLQAVDAIANLGGIIDSELLLVVDIPHETKVPAVTKGCDPWRFGVPSYSTHLGTKHHPDMCLLVHAFALARRWPS